jgi:hypothetical protein
MYLGLPISDRKLRLEQWLFLVRKLASRIEPWLSKLLTSGGRLILSNACLDSIPIFAMGLFLLHDGIHARFDSHRSKFFWEGTGNKRKYHMVNWPSVCRPKSSGGLGLLNSKKMNIALLSKWVWKLYQDDESIWATIIRANKSKARILDRNNEKVTNKIGLHLPILPIVAGQPMDLVSFSSHKWGRCKVI